MTGLSGESRRSSRAWPTARTATRVAAYVDVRHSPDGALCREERAVGSAVGPVLEVFGEPPGIRPERAGASAR